MDELDAWGDITFDTTTTFDLLLKNDDQKELPDRTFKILSSHDPLEEGLFNNDNDPLVTSDDLFGNLVENKDDEDEAELNAFLSSQLQQAGKNNNQKKSNSEYFPKGLPAFLLDQSVIPSGTDVHELHLSALELTSLDSSHKLVQLNSSNSKNGPFKKKLQSESTSFTLGFRTEAGYIISTKEELLSKMRTLILNVSELCYLTEPEAESLLRWYQWDMNLLQTAWAENNAKARLDAGIYRQMDSSCYVFGLGCISHFMTTSPLLLNSLSSIKQQLNNKVDGDKPISDTQHHDNNNNNNNNNNIIGSDGVLTWSELIKQLYYYYQRLYFTPSSSTQNPSSSLGFTIKPQVAPKGSIQPVLGTMDEDINDDGANDASGTILIPHQEDMPQVESLLLHQHSTNVASDLRDSFKFMKPNGNDRKSTGNLDGLQVIQTNNGTMIFPTLTSELTTTPQLPQRRNSISFSRLDIPLQSLYFQHAKNELSTILITLLRSFHFPQEIDLAKEFISLQRSFIQFNDNTTTVDDPGFRSGFHNSIESYSTDLQERLHSLRQVFQLQDKSCPHIGITSVVPFNNHQHYDGCCGSNHNDDDHHHQRGSVTMLRASSSSSAAFCSNDYITTTKHLSHIVENSDLPPFTTSFAIVQTNAYHQLLGNQKNKNESETQFENFSSDRFFSHIILPLDRILSSFTRPSSTVTLSPHSVSQVPSDTSLLSFLFSFFQQSLFFTQRRTVSEILNTFAPGYGSGVDMDDPFGILRAEQQQANGITDGNNDIEPSKEIPPELMEWQDIMNPDDITLWNDVFVDSDEVIQISPLLFNLPHHSIGSTFFYVKRADFELMYTLMSYQGLEIAGLNNYNRIYKPVAPTTTTTTSPEKKNDGKADNKKDNKKDKKGGVKPQEPEAEDEDKPIPDITLGGEFYYYSETTQVIIPNEPSVDDILDIFRQTDYYARYISFHAYQQSLLPPGKGESLHIPAFYQPTIFVQCSTAFCNIVRLDYAHALGCGHYFCRDCWRTNLQHHLVEKGREAITIDCMGGEYPRDVDSLSIDMTTHSKDLITGLLDLDSQLKYHNKPSNNNNDPTSMTIVSSTTKTTSTTYNTAANGKPTSAMAMPSTIQEDDISLPPPPPPPIPTSERPKFSLLKSVITKITGKKDDETQVKQVLKPIDYMIKGKCRSVIPMSFLHKIINSLQSPCPSGINNPIVLQSPRLFLEHVRLETNSLQTITLLRDQQVATLLEKINMSLHSMTLGQAQSLRSSFNTNTNNNSNNSGKGNVMLQLQYAGSNNSNNGRFSQQQLQLQHNPSGQQSSHFSSGALSQHSSASGSAVLVAGSIHMPTLSHHSSNNSYNGQNNGGIKSSFFVTNEQGITVNQSRLQQGNLSQHWSNTSGRSNNNNNNNNNNDDVLILNLEDNENDDTNIINPETTNHKSQQLLSTNAINPASSSISATSHPLQKHQSLQSHGSTQSHQERQSGHAFALSQNVLVERSSGQILLNRGGSSSTLHNNENNDSQISSNNNSTSLFPTALTSQTSLRRKEVDRMYDQDALLRDSANNPLQLLQQKRSVKNSQQMTSLSILNLATKVSNSSTLGNSQGNNGDVGSVVQKQENPNKLSMKTTESLSPTQVISPANNHRGAFLPFQSPTEHYNKLLWWILDIYVNKTPTVKWCPNPRCDSTHSSFSSSDDSSHDVHLALGSEVKPRNSADDLFFTVNIAGYKPQSNSGPKPTQDPSPYAITFSPNVTSYQVDCLCGTSICFRCLQPAHAPAPCDLYMKWKNQNSGALDEMWMGARTKPCPKCGVLIEKNRACNHMTCTCRHQFCWLCMRTWSLHTSAYTCSSFAASPENSVEVNVRTNTEKLNKFQYYTERVDQHNKGIEYCEYLKSLLTIALKRAPLVVLYTIIQKANACTGKSSFAHTHGVIQFRDPLPKERWAKRTVANPAPREEKKAGREHEYAPSDSPQESRHKYSSVRYSEAWNSLLSASRLNVFNLDLRHVVAGCEGMTTYEEADSMGSPVPLPYFKGIDIETNLPLYFPQWIPNETIDISNKCKHHLKIASQVVTRPIDVVNEPISTGLRERFYFLFTALDTLILSRKTLQYAFITAYYLKTQTSLIGSQALPTGKKDAPPNLSKSQKQLFELQLKYLIEPTERLQSLLDKLTDDLIEVFWHKKVIMELVSAISKMRKLLLDHINGTSGNNNNNNIAINKPGQHPGQSQPINNQSSLFEEALMYEPDAEMARDVWICSCRVEHQTTVAWCENCHECKLHREPECNACWRR